MKYFNNAIFILLIVLFVSCNGKKNSTLSIKLYNSDGSISPDLKVELYSISENKSNVISSKNRDHYTLDITRYGFYYLTLSNDKHESCFLPLFSDGQKDIAIEVYLPSIIGRRNYMPIYKTLPKFIFSDTTSIAYKIADINLKFGSDHSDYMDSFYYYKTNNINKGKYVNQNRNEILSQLKENLYKEKCKEVREMLYVYYLKRWFMIKPDPLDSTICANALREIKPNSLFWSFGGELINYAIWATHNNERYVSYANEVIKTTADPNVKAALLYERIMNLSSVNKFEEMTILIDKLKKECPNTYKAKIVESEFLTTAVGKEIPAFSFRSIDNPTQVFSKSNMNSKVYLIDFWGTWCTPCIGEMATLHKVYEKYKTKGFEIISVACDDKENVIAFRKNKWAMPWKNTFLLKNSKSDELLKTFGVYTFPSAFLISKEGVILARNEDLRGNYLENTLKKYLE